jgi:hypothetical protein
MDVIIVYRAIDELAEQQTLGMAKQVTKVSVRLALEAVIRCGRPVDGQELFEPLLFQHWIEQQSPLLDAEVRTKKLFGRDRAHRAIVPGSAGLQSWCSALGWHAPANPRTSASNATLGRPWRRVRPPVSAVCACFVLFVSLLCGEMISAWSATVSRIGSAARGIGSLIVSATDRLRPLRSFTQPRTASLH